MIILHYVFVFNPEENPSGSEEGWKPNPTDLMVIRSIRKIIPQGNGDIKDEARLERWQAAFHRVSDVLQTAKVGDLCSIHP